MSYFRKLDEKILAESEEAEFASLLARQQPLEADFEKVYLYETSTQALEEMAKRGPRA